VGAHKAGD